MEASIQKLAAICFFILGVSHIVQPRAWVRFFVLLHSNGEPGNFLNAFLNLAMGALIVSFHNVWSGIPALLTVVGWAYVLKSFLYFVFPKVGLKALARVTEEKASQFVVAGVVLVLFSGLLTYSLLVD